MVAQCVKIPAGRDDADRRLDSERPVKPQRRGHGPLAKIARLSGASDGIGDGRHFFGELETMARSKACEGRG